MLEKKQSSWCIINVEYKTYRRAGETGEKTVFKVGGGFENLPRGKRGWFKTIERLISKYTRTFEIFKSTSTSEIFEGTIVGLRSQFKYSTSDLTGITNPSCIKKARLFKKPSDFEFPVKSSVSYLNSYFNVLYVKQRFLTLQQCSREF